MGWSATHLGRFAEESKDRAGEGHNLPVLSVTKHRGILRSEEFFKKAVHSRDTSKYKVVRPGQFAYATIHLNEGSVGKLGTRTPGVVSPMYTVFDVNERIDSDYLLAVLKSRHSLRVYESITQGTVNRRGGISFRTLSDLVLHHPPLSEQRKIAAILSSADDVIEKSNGVIDQVQVVKRGLMQELFARGLPGRHARFKQTEIGRIPEEWRLSKLSDIASVQTGIAKNKAKAGPLSVAYLRVANVQDGFLNLAEIKGLEVDGDAVARYALRAGDVLLTEGGDADKLGRGAVWNGEIEPCLHQNHIFVARPFECIRPLFLSLYAGSSRGKSYFLNCSKQTTNLASMNSTQLKGLPVPIPLLDEQDAILERIGAVDDRLKREEDSVGHLRELKSALMSVLLTGELRVTPDPEARMTPKTAGWDELHLSENPAVELLESLGYTYLPPEDLEPERPSLKEAILAGRLAAALKRLNPWLSETNIVTAIKAVTQVPATSLAEANEKLYTSLTYGIALEQDRGDGRKSHTVRFLDFDNPDNNEWIVTRQYRVLGSKKHVIPDIAIFVNGLPLAIIECKSPTKGDGWKSEAVQQLHRYQELGTRWKGQGAPKLFEAAQILVGTCGERAVYGTVGTAERFFLEWKEPYPLSLKQLEDQLGRPPTPQDILLYGLLERRNLLDIIRNFVVFEVESGRTARKLTRYRQFIAVSEAMHRIRTANKPSARGGIVWHTQGSGKSLSMLWLALKLRRDPSQQQPTIVIVTDRTKLDGQIAGVFTACGFPNPERADSVRHLRRILEHPTGKTVMTTIQKFQDITGSSATPRDQSVHPTLSEATNIFVMVDEAHRTQYRSLAANMRQALPNACFLGFTGTPIDKKDRSTLRTFGPYIDTYTIEQAVRDKATVPIFYESRLPALQIIGQTIDKVFDHVFADRSDDERAAIKQRFATESAIAGAPRRIEAICLDLIEHFTKFIAPNGFKAQVVATSRHAAVTYKEALDRLNGPESALLMSSGHNDEERLARWHLSKEQQDRLIERFKDPSDPLSILVVCDMLLTGFDAPVEQVMYLDAALKEHTLLQAIARVNRPHGDEKTYGLVVDYWGVSVELSEALAVFSATDVQGALTPNMDELPRLQSRHAAAMRFFHAV